MPFCTDGGGDLPLTVSVDDPGEFVFNSTDLGISGLDADASGTTNVPVPAFTGTANSATYNLDISYTNLNGSCPADTTIELTALRAPDAEFTLDAEVICGTPGDFTATLVTASNAPDTYQLELADPSVGTVTNNNDDSWTVNVTMAGIHEVVMTSANGLNATCSETFTANVTLNVPPPVPVVVCGATGLDFVTFTWADTGHDSYVVNEISVPPGGIVTRNGNSVTISGLSVGDEVTISVTGITTGCADNTSAEESCLAQSCPEITLTVDTIATYCANDDELVTIAFTADGSDGSGTTVFTIDGAANDGTFNPFTLGAGTYEVRLLLDEGCDFIATATIQINEVPSSGFSLPDGPICVGETVLGEIAGATESGFTYLWTTDPSVNVTPGADDGERNFTFPVADTYDVSLTVTSADGCAGDEVIEIIEVVERLSVPAVTCDTVQTESVTFTWPDQALVDSFGIQVNGGPEFFQTGTTLFVGGLSVDSTVNISVIAYGDTPCPDLTPGTASCTSVSCPALFIATPEDLTFCESDDTTVRTLLTTTVTGDNGGGELIFSGPGVIRIGDDYFFDVDTAGVGGHLLTVNFEEGMCTETWTFTYTVNPTPEAAFAVTNDSGDTANSDLEANGLESVTVCVGQPFTLAYTGTLTVADGADFRYLYSPDAPTLIDSVDFQTYESAYDIPGVQRICLVIEQDGCPSDTVCLEVVCVPPPEPLVLECGSNGSGEIIFIWNDIPEATVYDLFDENGNDLICSTSETGVVLTGMADATATYDWDFDGATANAGANESYDLSWPVAGMYTVALTVTRNGCVATTSREVIVESPADAGTALVSDEAFCEGIAEVIELSERLADETPGGFWAGGNLPAGALDAPGGRLNLALLNPGDYLFTYTVGGNVCDAVSSTVSLTVIGAPGADAGMTQTLTCSMGMVSLDGGNSETGEGYTYLWTSTDPNNVIMDADQLMIDVGQPGTYVLEVTNAIGCTAVSEVIVDAETEAPVMELEISQITCFASDNGAISVTGVSGGRAPYTFTLNGEDRGASTLFAGLEPTEYLLRVTDANGCFSDILLDITQPEELTVQLSFPGDSTTVNAGDDVFISAIVNGGNTIDTLLWQPDSLATGEGRNGISFTASETRMISVTVVDELGCSATDRQMLLVWRDRPVYFPTAFSPNGDNINDFYFIGGDLDQIAAIRDFFIFNRWGEMLYSGLQNGRTDIAVGGGDDGAGFLPNDPAFGWDGTLNGKMINPQVCVYTATVEFSDGEVVVYKGDFVIMR